MSDKASVPQSEHGGIHPELAACMTAAKAALADFDRQADNYANNDDAPRPDFFSWAFLMRQHAKNLIDTLERLS